MCPLAIYKRSRRPLSLFVRGLILILCVISLNSQVSAVFASPTRPIHAHDVLTISGGVFDDYNQNGIHDPSEPGMNGIIVTFFNAANAIIGT